MSPEEMQRLLATKIDELKRYQEQDLPHIVGKEAVDHFQDSFTNEGFTDETTEQWPEVERRKPDSPWYGFSLNTKNRFSPTRAKDKILTGETNELRNSIDYQVSPGKVRVQTDKPYAAVHQFGMQAKVFGKKAFTMPKRPFIGRSKKLEENIYQKINRDLKRILKQ